jgi:DNA-binding response OmpR family regulator
MSQCVLIVDDSLTVRMDLAEGFESAGIEPISCASVKEARDALDTCRIDAVILDVRLPDGDGVELLAELRETPERANMPVLLLSSEADVKDRVRGLRTGADEYVGKPYDRNYLVARARQLMRPSALSAGESPTATTILLIDDSPTFVDQLRSSLEAAGYGVHTAQSGEQGLLVAATSRPSVIIVDGQLPGIDGATVIRRIRLDPALRRTPCILLTASDEDGAELRALDAGADAFCRKDDVSLVLARLNAVVRTLGEAARDEPSSLLGPKKILAVDDSPTFLEELSDTLRGEGYDVVQAHSGAEALELLAVQPADCILLDLFMPGLSGTETCERIKSSQVTRDIPLIMLTALDSREAMIDTLSAGADDYISKSSDMQVLKARVRAQIRRKQFEDETRRMREELLRKEVEAVEARAARELADTRSALVQELERKNQELEAFSYSVSHDLRAPLRSIDGFSQALLEDYSEQLDARAKDYLSRVRGAAQRMGDLIEDLLQLSRIGRADLVRETTDISQLARLVGSELAKQFPDRQVKFEVRDGLRADVDPRLLRVAFENLLSNAWKFTAKQSEARVEVGVTDREGSAVYFVRDNGAGFDMKFAQRLFRPFQRLHREADFPGTGIGLATVHRVIDRHGGRVWAESAAGAGTTFYFTLPEARAYSRMSVSAPP